MEPIRCFDAYTCIGPRTHAHPAAPHTLEHLLGEMRHCSIDGALVTSTRCLRYDPMLENRRLCDQLAEASGLWPLWHVFPECTDEFPEPDALLTEMRQRGAARAVVLAPSTAGWDPLSRPSEKLMTTLERERILTIVNVQEELPPQRVEALAAAHPNLPILMRNVKWELQRQTVPLLFHCENLHLGFDACQIHQGIEWLAERGCADRLLLTSNAPDMAMGAHRAYIDWAELPRETKQKIAGGNLTRLLHGQAPETTRENVDEDALMAEARRGAPLSARVLDAHAHMLDEGLNGGGGRHVMPAGGPSGVRRLAERLGVDGIGIMSWNGITVPDPDDGNRCVRDALDAHPGFYWGLATFDPVHDDAGTQRAKMEELFADERFLGFKPYTTFGLSYDDPKYEPWWRFGDERGLYAGLHPNRWDLAEFDALCPSYPNMTFVAFHCGRSYATADAAIEMARKHDNFRAEITLTPVCMGIIDYLVAGCGADRVLYGTDLPMRDPRQQLGWVVYSRLPVEEKKRVLGANAQALIDRVRAARAAAPGRSGSGTGSSRDG